MLCEWILVNFNCKFILKSRHWQVDICAFQVVSLSSRADVGEFQS